MWIGTGYMMVSLYPLFSNIYKSHARGTFTDGFMSKDRQIQGWLNNYYSHVSGEDAKYAASNMGEDQVIESMGYSRYSVYLKILSRYTFKNTLIFAFIICLSVFIALAILTIWQSWLVCYGETSVERMKSHNDRSECKRRKIKYNSPYHLGCMKNWKALLGFSDGWSFFAACGVAVEESGEFL